METELIVSVELYCDPESPKLNPLLPLPSYTSTYTYCDTETYLSIIV